MMVTRLSVDARKMVLTSAAEEARRRGDRRLGTDHLLLGMLHDADSPVARALGINLEAARAAADALDRDALAAVGVNLGVNVGDSHTDAGADGHQHGDSSQPFFRRGLPPLTSGARSVLKHTIDETRSAKTRSIETRQFLFALLSRERPDPAAELLHALGIDRSQVLKRLEGLSQ